MQRRSFVLGGLGAATAGALGLSTQANAGETITWKMVTSWPKNAPGVGTAAERLAQRITAMSGGRLTVTVYAAGELVAPFSVMDAVQQGTAEMAHTPSYYAASKSRALHFFTTVPFGLNADELAAWMRWGDGGKLLDEVLAPFGMRGFYAGNSGLQAMGWFNKEINKLDDIVGLKMRIAGLGGEALKKLGAVPVMMPPGEIFQAMQSGNVDAAEWIGPWNDIAFGLHKVAKFYYLPAFHEPGAGLVALVNDKAYAALPADLQEIVRVAVMSVAQDTLADFTYHNASSMPRLAELGVQVRHFSPEITAALGRASREVIEEVAKGDAMAQKVADSYLAFLRQASAYTAKMEQRMLEQRAAVWND